MPFDNIWHTVTKQRFNGDKPKKQTTGTRSLAKNVCQYPAFIFKNPQDKKGVIRMKHKYSYWLLMFLILPSLVSCIAFETPDIVLKNDGQPCISIPSNEDFLKKINNLLLQEQG